MTQVQGKYLSVLKMKLDEQARWSHNYSSVRRCYFYL